MVPKFWPFNPTPLTEVRIILLNNKSENAIFRSRIHSLLHQVVRRIKKQRPRKVVFLTVKETVFKNQAGGGS